MSQQQQVRFEERDTTRTTTQRNFNGNGNDNGNGGGRGGGQETRHKEGFAHEIGDALTKGAGPNGYLAVRTYIAAM